MINLQTSITVSTGIVNVSWNVEKYYFTSDGTKAYYISDITGFNFNDPYFGKLLSIYEADKNRYEYIEQDITNQKLNPDSLLVLEEIKNYTTANIKY